MIVLILIVVICAPLLLVAAFNQQPPPKAPLSDFDFAAARKKTGLMVYGAMRVPSEMFAPDLDIVFQEGWANSLSYASVSRRDKDYDSPPDEELSPLVNAEIEHNLRAMTDGMFISGEDDPASPNVLQTVAQPEQSTPKQFIDHIKACVAQLRERDPLRGIPKDHVCVIHPRWIPELDKISKGDPNVAPFPITL